MVPAGMHTGVLVGLGVAVGADEVLAEPETAAAGELHGSGGASHWGAAEFVPTDPSLLVNQPTKLDASPFRLVDASLRHPVTDSRTTIARLPNSVYSSY